MAASTNVLDELKKDAQTPADDAVVVQWPLSYRLTISAEKEAQPGQPLQQQCRTRARSEEIAELFLNEPVLGFDMEWPWQSKSARLQEKVGLIQIASESRIGLFHIGLHVGETTEDLISPSLQKIIESPDIIKTGVGIVNADFSRLENHFGLKPKAALELSHLHRLVTYGQEQPKLVTTKLVALATQVQFHLGLPLWKGKDRTSDWSKALSKSQIDYAADDAYCAFMLYHCMNAKRSVMDPEPPMPLLADEYADKDLPLSKAPIRVLLLQPREKGDAPIPARKFFKKPCKDEEKSESDTEVQELTTEPAKEADEPAKKSRHRKRAPKTVQTDVSTAPIPLDEREKELFEMLKQRRKELASTHGLAAYVIAHNTALEDLARHQPLDNDGLLLIKGIGPAKAEKYGEDWIKVIAQFNAEKKPPQPIPQLHTGLSFTVEQITIDPGTVSQTSQDSDSDSDSSSAFGSPLPTPPARTHSLPPQPKRKRSPTPPRSPNPPPRSPPPPSLSLPSQIFLNKLLAFSKLVTAKLSPRPLTPIVSDATLRQIVAQPPRTKRELWMVPDIQPFVRACALAKCDLLGNIDKWRLEAEVGD